MLTLVRSQGDDSEDEDEEDSEEEEDDGDKEETFADRCGSTAMLFVAHVHNAPSLRPHVSHVARCMPCVVCCMLAATMTAGKMVVQPCAVMCRACCHHRSYVPAGPHRI